MVPSSNSSSNGTGRAAESGPNTPCELNGCHEAATGRIECVCNTQMCNGGESWNDPCSDGPGADVAELHASLGAVIIVDMMLMFSSFIIALLL